jgi:polysaccharide export outer membrane protein
VEKNAQLIPANLRKFDGVAYNGQILSKTVALMRKLFSFYIIFVIVLACTSCSNQYQVLFQKSSAIADTASQKAAMAATVYHIKPEDILQIKNLQDPEFLANQVITTNTGGAAGKTESDNNSFQVAEDGAVNLPIIGPVQVAGLTRIDAQTLIQDLYKKAEFKNPIIDLRITNLKVTLLGEIKTQGSFPLVKDKTTLVELIGEAGGLTDKANEKTVKIIRGNEKTPNVTEVNLNDITSINDPKAVLQSGDIIYVAQSKRAARNDNLQNVSLLVQPILLLFNTVLIVFTLVRK